MCLGNGWRVDFERSGHFRVTQTAPERLEHHESERNYEQQLRAKTHDSPRSALVSCDVGYCAGRLLFLFYR